MISGKDSLWKFITKIMVLFTLFFLTLIFLKTHPEAAFEIKIPPTHDNWDIPTRIVRSAGGLHWPHNEVWDVNVKPIYNTYRRYFPLVFVRREAATAQLYGGRSVVAFTSALPWKTIEPSLLRDACKIKTEGSIFIYAITTSGEQIREKSPAF